MPASDLYNLRFESGAVTRARPLPVCTGDPGSTTATISSGQSLSSGVDLSEQRLHRITLPATWTAAGITFQVSIDNSNWFDLYNELGEYFLSSSVVAASRSILVDQMVFYGIRYLKIRSGTSGSAVAQGGDRTLTLVTVPR